MDKFCGHQPGTTTLGGMTEFDPQAPFRSGSGRDNGLSRRALTGKSFRRLHRDCYVSSERPLDLRTRLQAALEMVPGVMASATTPPSAGWVALPRTPLTFTSPYRTECGPSYPGSARTATASCR